VIGPLYVSVAALDDKKSSVAVIFQLFLFGGMVVANVIGWALIGRVDVHINWRVMTEIGILFPITLAIISYFCMQDSNTSDLQPVDVESPPTSNESDHSSDSASLPGNSSFLEYFRPKNIKYVLYGVVLSASTQLVGAVPVIYFAPTIFKTAGVSDPYLANIGSQCG